MIIGALNLASSDLSAVRFIRAQVASLFDTAGGENYDAERAQATVRLVIVLAFNGYMMPIIFGGSYSSAVETTFLTAFIVYMPTAVFLLWWVVRRPGEFLLRRLLSMALDYSAITFAMSVGGEALLPVYSALLWVTVGNGVRFGPRYLVIATGFALISLAVTTYWSAFWQDNFYVVLTLVLTTLLVPAYIHRLLTRVHGAYQAAMEANLAKSRFLAQASHDLRQPIHAISLFTACLRDAGLDREGRQMVENIERSLQSVSSLFRSLLDVSTLDSGKVAPIMEAIPVGKLIEDNVRQNAQAAEWARVTLRFVSSSCYVRADAALLSTMIQNIVNNALKYAAGRPVLIGCRRSRGRLRIEIHDQGGGIREEYLPRVFDEFYRVRERGDKDVEGVGLGLSIVRRLAELMGLSVSIHSGPDKGTTVVIAGLEIMPAPAVSTRSAVARPSSVIAGMRILLVEDDEEVLLATSTLLRKWGCVVHARTTPPVERTDYEILLTDYDLGEGKTGADCIAQVRRLNEHPVSAVIMTGHNEQRVRAELDDKTIPILAKPVRPAELRSILNARALLVHRRRQ
jgi:signal transduction histidine kinase/CheY-like chemotaxis protein